MNSKAQTLEPAFIERQRQQLSRLRSALLAAAYGETEESRDNGGSEGGPREFEDDAQKLTMLELEGHLVRRDRDRLVRVNRALKKIEEGTYGRSDISGREIPRQRLEAIPEALCTITEEQEQEQEQRRHPM
jgi:DnaK suppressor protein